MALQHPKAPHEEHHRGATDAVFTAEMRRVPSLALPAEEMRGEVAYQIVHDELMLDGNARLNLATFVTTHMDPFADKLMTETFDKNMIDKDEYPQTAVMEMRCVNMLSRLWHAPDPHETTGCSTLSIMFLSKVSVMSLSANGSMCVVTKVARLRRALPSSMSSSWTI